MINIGAFTTRIGFLGPLCYSYNKEPQNVRGNYQGPHITRFAAATVFTAGARVDNPWPQVEGLWVLRVWHLGARLNFVVELKSSGCLVWVYANFGVYAPEFRV